MKFHIMCNNRITKATFRLRNMIYLFGAIGLMSCQKEALTLDETEARILNIVTTGARRNNRNDADKFPYMINYTVHATLKDITDVQEWGVYFIDNNTKELIEFEFNNVSHNESFDLSLYVTAKYFHKGEKESYIEASERIGLYIKKGRAGEKNGDIKTYYGELNTISLKYSFPNIPSVYYANPRIVSTEDIEVDSVLKKKTEYSCEITVSGAFWIDHLENVLSRGWSWDNESNYFLKDGKHTKTYTMTYSPGQVHFSQWILIHCHDGMGSLESNNWLNISGNPQITTIVVDNDERDI